MPPVCSGQNDNGTLYLVEMGPSFNRPPANPTDEYDPLTRQSAARQVLAPWSDGSWLAEPDGTRVQWTDWPVFPDDKNVCQGAADEPDDEIVGAFYDDGGNRLIDWASNPLV